MKDTHSNKLIQYIIIPLSMAISFLADFSESIQFISFIGIENITNYISTVEYWIIYITIIINNTFNIFILSYSLIFP